MKSVRALLTSNEPTTMAELVKPLAALLPPSTGRSFTGIMIYATVHTAAANVIASQAALTAGTEKPTSSTISFAVSGSVPKRKYENMVRHLKQDCDHNKEDHQ